MLVLVGPSASGKTEVGIVLEKKYNIKKLITYTTREKRLNEVDGKDYHFLTPSDFIDKMNKGFFFETIIYSNNYYGTAEEDIKDNSYVILDPIGLNTYRNSSHFVISFYFNVPEDERVKRMEKRKDSPIDIERRLAFDKEHFSPNLVKNVDFNLEISDESIERIAEIVYKKYQDCLLANN